MLFGYSLSLRRNTEPKLNKTQYGSGHYSGVLWDVCRSSVEISRYIRLVVLRRYLP